MKNILAILALAGGIHLAFSAGAEQISFSTPGTGINDINDQDTTKTRRETNPKNKKEHSRDKLNMPPDIRTDTASVPPPPFDTLSNPSRNRRT